MDKITTDTLELGVVLDRLKGFLYTDCAKNFIGTAVPFQNITEVKKSYNELTELNVVLDSDVKFDISNYSQVDEYFSKIAPSNSYLLGEDFSSVARSLKVLSQLKRLISVEEIFKELPLIVAGLKDIGDYSEFHLLLKDSVNDTGDILDTASFELANVREKINGLKTRVRSLIDSIMKEKSLEGVLQDDIVSIREDRFVFAVKAERHKDLPGIIHGRSQTLQTAFIEPLELVNINNDLLILKKEEKEEEIKVLKKLTDHFRLLEMDLLKDESIIVWLDMLLAKARFMDYLNAIVPDVYDGGSGEVRLLKARHPVLMLNELSNYSNHPVIPIDIILREDVKALIVSGANAGGKTVALKSLGLITLMCWFALPVPVEEGSKVVLFNKIFSDIGDTQDLTMELSTYTGHLKRINTILENADSSTLILLDEIGTGTDPSEGGAMALALIEEFLIRGARLAVTTHLNIIKAHGSRDDRFLNATVVFDDRTMTPRYVIEYGVPGLSMGITVAESLGFHKNVIERAKNILKGDESFFVETLTNLKTEMDEVRELKEKLTSLESKKTAQLKILTDQKSELKKKLKKSFEEKLKKVEAELADILKNVKASKKTADLNALKTEKEKLKTLKSSMKETVKSDFVPRKDDLVTVGGEGKELTVLKVNEKNRTADVKGGIMKMTIKWTELVPVKKVKNLPSKKTIQTMGISSYETESGDGQSTMEIKVIGKRVDEALETIEPFLDNAHVNGMISVDIIHGLGTGALKKAIHEYLATNPVVSSFKLKTEQSGGEGVTEVKLK